MKTRFNEDLLLWAIATLQPASIGDALFLIQKVFPEIAQMPKISSLQKTVEGWSKKRYVLRVHGKSRLYSITILGNRKLSIPLRRHRDKARLFLLKAARYANLYSSGETQRGLAGASPAGDGSSSTQEGSRPINSAGSPRAPRPTGRIYWPRVAKQLAIQVGSELRSPDTFFEYYSFPSVQAIHNASDGRSPADDLSITDLGIAIGVSPRLLTSFTHRPAGHYRQFEIGKRSGGNRVISSPKTFLKVVQYWLLDYALWNLPVHENCHSYRRGHSILTNATPHVGRRFVGNMDIEDYFGSISEAMLERFLRSNGFGDLFSNTIAKLTTLEDSLPQGAPTSPWLSNAYLYSFDLEMATWAGAHGLVYTRYADDITISGEQRDHIEQAIGYARERLLDKGFRINKKKTLIASQSGQQRVTGVVVNKKPQPPRKFRRKIRAVFHQAALRPAEFRPQLPQLSGYISYLQSYPALRNSRELEKYRRTLAKMRHDN